MKTPPKMPWRRFVGDDGCAAVTVEYYETVVGQRLDPADKSTTFLRSESVTVERAVEMMRGAS